MNEDDEVLAVGAYQVMVRRYLEPRVAALPEDRDGYLDGLLELHHDLTKRGHPDPQTALAIAMRVPGDVVGDALREARER